MNSRARRRKEFAEWANDYPNFGDDFDYEDSTDCLICGGDGFVESDDPLWDGDDYVTCYSCHGSGARKDMTVW